LKLSPGGEPYEWMCTTLIPSVVGWKSWSRRKKKETLSDIATCSDESFVLLTLENNYLRWMAEAEWVAQNKDRSPVEQETKNYPEAKYTNSGKSKRNGRSRRLHGWAREGYLRFNELYQLVQQDRLRRANFEVEMMAKWRDGDPADGSDSEPEDDDDEIFPANDLEGFVAPVGTCVSQGNYDDEEDQYDPENAYVD
jgi:hypothetical protein